MKKLFSNEIVILAIVTLIVTTIILWFYFSNFHGPPSVLAADWGSFGSYLNGVLSPILLFLNLIYLARTLQAQRDLQAGQKKEFEITSKYQQRQISELENANQQQQIADLRTELIKFLNNEVAIDEQYKSDLYNRQKKITTNGMVNQEEVKELERLSEEITKSFNRRLNLRNIATSLISQNFRTVDGLREYFNNRYEDFVKKFGRIYT